MKMNLAILAAGTIVLAPTLAAAQQTQPATGSAQTQTADPQAAAPDASAPAAKADPACDPAAAKTAKAQDKTAARPAPKVGKDTGDLPPPRTKKSASNAAKDNVCNT